MIVKPASHAHRVIAGGEPADVNDAAVDRASAFEILTQRAQQSTAETPTATPPASGTGAGPAAELRCLTSCRHEIGNGHPDAEDAKKRKERKRDRRPFLLVFLLRPLRNLRAAGSTGHCNIMFKVMFEGPYGKTQTAPDVAGGT